MSDTTPADISPQGSFPVTRWSVVLRAKDPLQAESIQALETLCQIYWYPIYAFVRNQGWNPIDAQDLTQEFFARLLKNNYLKSVKQEKGRFRTFLRVAIKRFLSNELEHLHAQKRGGHQCPIPLNSDLAEDRLAATNLDSLPPDQLYDRHWALTLLDDAIGRLEQEYTQSKRSDEFSILKPHLTTDRGTIPYGQLAARLHCSDGAARVAMHRLRKRFREVFHETIIETVAAPQEAEQEFRDIITLLVQSV